ncbi:hypothetical protein HC251_05705 [Iamia sp. SCSIO 61187]|uniref:hypothetical protein n=1 Tax=Iamia sp. SCSIO 61187 TaxID=2722752 RepID=UPI001C6323E5|nr:hypothetical protein [Iamia sp. SCSIO 61187]QYG91981.1 hypothetical protein HC251_05705 [Iamia sp. SCSIO 61187]
MPATRLRRAAALMAVAALPLAGLAACGEDEGDDDDQEEEDGGFGGGESEDDD